MPKSETLHQRLKKIIAPLNALEKAMGVFMRTTQLCVTYGFVLGTPAKEIKRMKLRQIEKELKALKEGNNAQ